MAIVEVGAVDEVPVLYKRLRVHDPAEQTRNLERKSVTRRSPNPAVTVPERIPIAPGGSIISLGGNETRPDRRARLPVTAVVDVGAVDEVRAEGAVQPLRSEWGGPAVAIVDVGAIDEIHVEGDVRRLEDGEESGDVVGELVAVRVVQAELVTSSLR